MATGAISGAYGSSGCFTSERRSRGPLIPAALDADVTTTWHAPASWPPSALGQRRHCERSEAILYIHVPDARGRLLRFANKKIRATRPAFPVIARSAAVPGLDPGKQSPHGPSVPCGRLLRRCAPRNDGWGSRHAPIGLIFIQGGSAAAGRCRTRNDSGRGRALAGHDTGGKCITLDGRSVRRPDSGAARPCRDRGPGPARRAPPPCRPSPPPDRGTGLPPGR